MPDNNDEQPSRPKLSIVIPAYNEARRIGRTIQALRDYVSRTATPCELIVVDDGSKDRTADVVRQSEPESLNLRLLVNPINRGKGHSVRQGMLAATGDVLAMCDADLASPIEEVDKLLVWLDRGYDVVIGSRDLPDSRLDPPQPPLRRLMAGVFRALRRRLLLPALRDTQCGLKVFRCDVAREAFSCQTIDGWLFDCEVLAIADRLGFRIKEVGVVWRDDRDSRVKVLPEVFSALPTLLRIRRRLASLNRV